MERVVPGVWRMGSEMVCWYLVEEQGRLTAIDGGVAGFASTLEEDLGALGFALDDVDAIVLTHGDADHTGVAPALQRAGAKVLVHADDERALRKPALKSGDAAAHNFMLNAWRPPVLRTAFHVIRRSGGKVSSVKGAATFADGDELDVPGGIRVTHTPGHTAGHCVLLAPQHRVLFAGDQLCTHPWMTGDGTPQLMPRFYNVDDAATFAMLDRVEPLDADVVCVGHGAPFHGSPAEAVASARRARG
jgi:glyoxylase-like metal-dependent hydrolase (beta-lactamase superfamily II)